jgi:hypothetical protein
MSTTFLRKRLLASFDGGSCSIRRLHHIIMPDTINERGFALRWREQLENGTRATIAEIAAAEKINETYVGRVLRLTLVAPDIVEAILGGWQPAEVTLAGLMRPFPVGWREQWAHIFEKGTELLSNARR